MADPFKKVKIQKPSLTKEDEFTKYIKKIKTQTSGAKPKRPAGGWKP